LQNAQFWTSDSPLEASDEGLQATEDVRLDAIADPRTVDLAADETCLLQDLEVLRHRRLRERQLVDDVTADARLPADEETQDLHARYVADGLAEERQLLVGLDALDRTEIGFLLRP